MSSVIPRTIRITWHRTAPDAGSEACVCSLCGERIEGSPPARSMRRGRHAQFHRSCFEVFYATPRGWVAHINAEPEN